MAPVATVTKLPALHDALLSTAEAFINQPSSSDTTSEEYLGNFHYEFWDSDDPDAKKALQPVFDLLLKEEHRRVTEANLEFANRDVDLKKHSIELVITEYLNDFLNYLIPRIINLDDWKAGFQKCYQQFETEFMSDTFTVEFFGHLGNFSYQFSDTGELNEHTRIVVLSTFGVATKHEYLCNKRADFFRLQAALSSCFPEIDDRWRQHPEFLHYRRSFPKAEARPSFSAYELMRKFVLAIRILSPSHAKPFCDFAVAFHQGQLSGTMPSQAVSFPEDRIDKSGWVSFEWPNWLRRLWEQLEGADYMAKLMALDHHVDDSLKRGHRSAKNPYSKQLQIVDELERLSDYFSAFDSIYKEEIKGDTAKKLANLTARLMTHQWGNRSMRQPNEYQMVYDEVHSMYQIRNDYEHGRAPVALRKAGKPEDFKERVRSIGYYLKQAAIIYMMNDDFDARIPQLAQGNCVGLHSIY